MCIASAHDGRSQGYLRRHAGAQRGAEGVAGPAVQAWAGRCLVALLLLLGADAACAHPVAQGALRATVDGDALRLRATLSIEEVLVGTLYLGQAERPDAVRLQRYGDYLREHVQVRADGALLQGRVLRAPAQLRAPLEYEFEYRFAGPVPREFRLAQDALREFPFAPGNPWEARYLLQLANAPAPAAAVLLTSANTVTLHCDGAAAACSLAVGERRLGPAMVGEGIRHILTGYDHLLFVAALLLAVGGLWDLIKVVSAFTLAHTLTLVLATFDIVRFPAGVVEPMIAASIVAVAAQNLFLPRQSRGSARLATAFAFGLFHGLGFAGGFLDAMTALSVGGTLWALAAFSLGVELGHQIVVLPLFAALRAWRRYRDPVAAQAVALRGGSALIGVAGLFYLVLSLRAA